MQRLAYRSADEVNTKFSGPVMHGTKVYIPVLEICILLQLHPQTPCLSGQSDSECNLIVVCCAQECAMALKIAAAMHTHIDDSCHSHVLFELRYVCYISWLRATQQLWYNLMIIQPSVVVVLIGISIFPPHCLLHFFIVSI